MQKLASSLGRKDEQPNIDLAAELVESGDRESIAAVVRGLDSDEKQIADDCIKVLYEIGERAPELISGYAAAFLDLLSSGNNRLVWGAMTALSKIAHLCPGELFRHLPAIRQAYENGSVITVDHSISVFAEIARADRAYAETVFPVIIHHLQTCRPKEVPQHAERAFICVNRENAKVFLSVLSARIEMLTQAQRKRVAKLMEKAARLGE